MGADDTLAAAYSPPEAYTVEDYPPTGADTVESPDSPRSKLATWGIPAAALVLALAALVFAITHWVRVTHGASPAVVWQPGQTVTSTKPVVTVPDKDTAFLMDLDRQGVWSVSAYGAVHDAQLVCRAIHIGGASHDQIAAGLIDAHIAGKDMTDRAAVEKFINVAVQHYCPDVAA